MRKTKILNAKKSNQTKPNLIVAELHPPLVGAKSLGDLGQGSPRHAWEGLNPGMGLTLYSTFSSPLPPVHSTLSLLYSLHSTFSALLSSPSLSSPLYPLYSLRCTLSLPLALPSSTLATPLPLLYSFHSLGFLFWLMEINQTKLKWNHCNQKFKTFKTKLRTLGAPNLAIINL